MRPETRYARVGSFHIAYQAVGAGALDLALVDQWFSNVDAQWRLPPLARFLERLAGFSRLIVLDKRGTGLSDPVGLGGLPTLEEWMDDIRGVLDAVGSQRAALLSGVGATYLTTLFAATYPERTAALILVDGYARLTSGDGYLEDAPASLPEADVERIRAGWGQGALLRILAPRETADPTLVEAFGEYERASASPGTAAAMIRMLYDGDVRDVLPAIRVPTLIMGHRSAERIPIMHSRYLAEHIPGARFVELPGDENLIWAGDQDRVLSEVQEFLTGARPDAGADRVLATVLFTDIVDSTGMAARLGDRAWRELLADHDRAVRSEFGRFRGREVGKAGDGFLATFDGPARAIRCAVAVREALRPLGVPVRAGLHTGEIELVGEDVAGLAVHIGARVAGLAGADEVLVTSTVRDLVIGSGIAFEPRGSHELRGVPGRWSVFAVNAA